MQDINEVKSEIQWILARRKLTMSDIRHFNQVTGHYFFERKTMKFFDSRVESAAYSGPGGVYFITSEKCGFASTQRKFAVRKFNPETGDVTTVGDTFNKFDYAEDARAMCRELARTPPTNEEPPQSATPKLDSRRDAILSGAVSVFDSVFGAEG